MTARSYRVSFFAVLACAALAACSEPAETLSRNLAAAGDADGDDGDGDLDPSTPPPNDDPAIGGDTTDPAPTDDPSDDEPAKDAGPAKDGGTDAGTPPAQKVASPVPGKVVTYPYGVKNPRYAAGYHTGEDYATATGSNAVAVRSGTIRWSNDAGGAYGKWMGLDADNGRTYVYCHLSSRLFKAGDKVVAGQVIAKTGATGNVTGPHLHFEDHPLGPFKYAQVRKPAW